MIRSIFFILLIALSFSSIAQSDSMWILSYDEFIEIVKTHHPLSRQANLQRDKGDATLTKARGGFDPKLEGSMNQKYYKDQQYYSYVHAGLKVPTWFGLSAQGGYELNDGTYLNPSSRVPDDGLWYAGLSLSLGKGLLIDERRAELKQAKIYLESAEIEGKIMMNQLFFDASVAYWDWFKAYHKMKIYEGAVENASIRLEGVKSSAFLGDRPFIDTVEARIQLQNRMIGLNQSKMEFLNKSQMLEVYLWQDGYVPLSLTESTYPTPADQFTPAHIDPSITAYKDSLIQSHPELILYQNKLDMKSIDLRLKKQGILPSIDLKYNLLSEPVGPDVFSEINPSDYNWGVQLNYPLFTRKERGSIRLAKIELEQLEMDRLTKIQMIDYKVSSAINTWSTSIDQILLYERTVNDYITLLNGEQTLFEIGESSLFLLNSRERSLIDSQLKLIDFKRDNQIAKVLVDYQLVNITF